MSADIHVQQAAGLTSPEELGDQQSPNWHQTELVHREHFGGQDPSLLHPIASAENQTAICLYGRIFPQEELIDEDKKEDLS